MITNLEEELVKPLVVLKFWAEWCGPCKTINVHLEKMKEEFPTVNIVPVNTDENPTLIKKYNIRNIPALVFLKNGEEVDRIVGAAAISSVRTCFRALSENS